MLFIIASPKWPTAVNWYATDSARLVRVFYDFMIPFVKNFTFSHMKHGAKTCRG